MRPIWTELRSRLAAVRRELMRRGFYEHPPEEIAYGARASWRNHASCIGRLFWDSLELVDCRDIPHADDVAGRVCAHMEAAFSILRAQLPARRRPDLEGRLALDRARGRYPAPGPVDRAPPGVSPGAASRRCFWDHDRRAPPGT